MPSPACGKHALDRSQFRHVSSPLPLGSLLDQDEAGVIGHQLVFLSQDRQLLVEHSRRSICLIFKLPIALVGSQARQSVGLIGDEAWIKLGKADLTLDAIHMPEQANGSSQCLSLLRFEPGEDIDVVALKNAQWQVRCSVDLTKHRPGHPRLRDFWGAHALVQASNGRLDVFTCRDELATPSGLGRQPTQQPFGHA